MACTAGLSRTPLRSRRVAPAAPGRRCTRWAAPAAQVAERTQMMRGHGRPPAPAAHPGHRPVTRRPWHRQKASAAHLRTVRTLGRRAAATIRALAASWAGERPLLLRRSATAQAGRAALPSRGCVVAWTARSRRELQSPQPGPRKPGPLQHQGRALPRTLACGVAAAQPLFPCWAIGGVAWAARSRRELQSPQTGSPPNRTAAAPGEGRCGAQWRAPSPRPQSLFPLLGVRWCGRGPGAGGSFQSPQNGVQPNKPVAAPKDGTGAHGSVRRRRWPRSIFPCWVVGYRTAPLTCVSASHCFPLCCPQTAPPRFLAG